jgi:hypothetical protein
MTGIESQFRAARRVSTPLVAIQTADPQATMASCCTWMNGDTAILVWDIVRGTRALGAAGAAAWSEISGEVETVGPAGLIDTLIFLGKMPDRTALFVLNAHRILADDPAISQAVWNVRDPSKAQGRMVILLAPTIDLPAELDQDVLVMDEPLPDVQALSEIVRQSHQDAGLEPDGRLESAAEALTGLSAFAADQASAMSMTPDGVDLEMLWDKKRQMIDATPGLTIWRGAESYDRIGGAENIKGFLRRILAGKRAPRAIVFIDEIEKAMAGASGGGNDSSGVSQDYLGVMLEYMQDTQATGMIFVGPPGAAKSVMAKAAGNEAGIPTLKLDLGGLKAAGGGLVGGAERTIRAALKVVTAVGAGEVMFIATSNKITNLPPALRRRFSLGTYYFDLPDADERAAIWNVYEDTPGDHPDDDGWTGAEIEKCLDISDRMGCTLEVASEFIVPVSRVDPEGVQALQRQAHGRYISASHPGVYRMPDAQATAPATGRLLNK